MKGKLKMNELKITNETVISQYRELDENTKCFASAMLQLIAATFQSLYKIQCIGTENIFLSKEKTGIN